MSDDISARCMNPYDRLVGANRIGYEDQAVAYAQPLERVCPTGEHRSINGGVEFASSGKN